MRPEDFTYVVESQRGAREALAAVWEAAMMVGWVVVGDYDLSGLLAAHDDRREVKVSISAVPAWRAPSSLPRR